MSAENNEQFPDFDLDVSAFDALLVDPVISELIGKLKGDINNATPLSIEDARRLNSQYDQEWYRLNLMGESAVISGPINLVATRNEDGPPALEDAAAQDMLVKSNGFTIVSKIIDEEMYRSIALLFEQPIVNSDGNVVDTRPVIVELDKLQFLRFNDVMSLKQARAVISYYASDKLELLDEAMLGANNELEAVEAMRGFVWDLAETGDDALLVAKALSVYTSELLKFEEMLPYTVPAGKTTMYTVDDDGSNLAPAELELTTPTAININSLIFIQPIIPGIDTNDFLVPHIDCWIHNEHMHETSSRAYVPVSGFETILSFRNAFRESNARASSSNAEQ